MIQRLSYKKKLDVYCFVTSVIDRFNDFYVTVDKNRLFLKDLNLIEKILLKQEVYAAIDKEIDGMLMVYREKGFRPYVKVLAKDGKTGSDLIKFLIWNFATQDLFVKIKKSNPLVRILQRYGFIQLGDRGLEVLLTRKGDKGAKNDRYNNKD